jgi:transcriptional regulator with XRE-family HTH domain
MSYKPNEIEFLKNLGERIRKLREEKGLSQEKLSFACNLHRTYISSVERGERNIAVINLAKVADALGVSLNQLFDGIDNLKDDNT